MWVDPGSVTVKFLTSQKIKILYDSSDPSFKQEALAAGTSPAGAASSAVVETPAVACSQEYSSLQTSAAAVSNIPTQRV